jgi:hypothetical protein
VYKLPSKDPRKSLLMLYRFAEHKHVKEVALVHFGHDVYMIIWHSHHVNFRKGYLVIYMASSRTDFQERLPSVQIIRKARKTKLVSFKITLGRFHFRFPWLGYSLGGLVILKTPESFGLWVSDTAVPSRLVLLYSSS